MAIYGVRGIWVCDCQDVRGLSAFRIFNNYSPGIIPNHDIVPA